MRGITLLLPLILLAGCSRASIPDLEDVPPAQASAGTQTPVENVSNQQATGSGTQASDETAREVANSTISVELTPEQRSDIERSVKRGLSDPNSAIFSGMAARISQFTSRSYLVCGWVDPGNGNQPFVAMYVPKTRNALLIGVGGRQPADAIRQRCSAEGVPLNS